MAATIGGLPGATEVGGELSIGGIGREPAVELGQPGGVNFTTQLFDNQ